MIALIDVGNTRLKWAVWGEGDWQARGWLPTADFGRLVDDLKPWKIDWIGISSVAGEAACDALGRQLAAISCPVHWLQSAADAHGLHNAYRRPGQLGADRFAMLVACRRMGLAPCVVAGAGTALTVDALSAEGVFLGGLILPGCGLMRQALQQGTAGLGEVVGEVVDFPQATGDAVESGIGLALSATVEVMRNRLAAVSSGPVAVVLAGGDVTRIASQLRPPVRIIEDLVLEGLLWVARDLAVPGA